MITTDVTKLPRAKYNSESFIGNEPSLYYLPFFHLLLTIFHLRRHWYVENNHFQILFIGRHLKLNLSSLH